MCFDSKHFVMRLHVQVFIVSNGGGISDYNVYSIVNLLDLHFLFYFSNAIWYHTILPLKA